MVELVRGQNVPLAAPTFVVEVGGSMPLEIIALLIPATREPVDDDLVFWNAPRLGSALDRTESARWMRVSLPHLVGAERVVFAAYADGEQFSRVGAQRLRVLSDTGEEIHGFSVPAMSTETLSVLGEAYINNEKWKFRAIGQGYESGLTGFITDHGIKVDDDAAPVPPAPAPLAPLPEPVRVQAQRPQQQPQRPAVPVQQGGCRNCGVPLGWMQRLRGDLCKDCAQTLSNSRSAWSGELAEMISAASPAQVQAHIASGPSRGVSMNTVGAEVDRVGSHKFNQLVAMAFADEVIDDSELADFDIWSRALGYPSAGAGLRLRMLRGQQLTKIRTGNLPKVSAGGLHLAGGTVPHHICEATYIRPLASGPRLHPGQLIVTNLGVSFLGDSGHEYAFGKVLSVQADRREVVVSTTYNKGRRTYLVQDSEYVAAVTEGALRVAKRLVTGGGENGRDDRKIPQAVKIEVWRRDDGKCVECGNPHALCYDHIIAWSKGGSSKDAANIQLLCVPCNLAKGDRL